jgi:hypothetical protein
MDSPAPSGAHNSRGPRSRPSWTLKNHDTETNAFEANLNARATNGQAAVGAQTMNGMTIVKMANPALNQTFLRGLQAYADSADGLAEGIVGQTPDGLVELRTQSQWVAHKLSSLDDTGTERYKLSGVQVLRTPGLYPVPTGLPGI